MKKRIIAFLQIFLITVVLFFIVGEGLLRLIGMKPGSRVHITVNPPGFFKIDSLLGWTNKEGKFTISLIHPENVFHVTVNDRGNRITSFSNDRLPTKPVIHIYGCSCTFGFSVSDTATQCFKLQTLLPNAVVINKGVPGYGLPQMYLKLQQSLSMGDTPDIAVFNYAYYHERRTPLNKGWIADFAWALSAGYQPEFKKMNYPYMEYENDSLQVKYCAFDNLAKDWPGRNHSALINLINTLYYGVYDQVNQNHLHLISQKTVLAIMDYCEKNHVTPLFATMTPDRTDMIDTVAAHGYYTLSYGIQVYHEVDTPNIYNCGKLDPQHPNGLAHSIYAQKVYDFLLKNRLLSDTATTKFY